jgi:hypothetical protein
MIGYPIAYKTVAMLSMSDTLLHHNRDTAQYFAHYWTILLSAGSIASGSHGSPRWMRCHSMKAPLGK